MGEHGVVLDKSEKYSSNIYTDSFGADIMAGRLHARYGQRYLDYRDRWVRAEAMELQEFPVNIGRAEYRGKGYGSDALVQLLRFGFFHLGLNRIWSAAVVLNEISLGSNDKVGMTREGILRQFFYINGEFVDGVALSMLREGFDRTHGTPDEWEARKAAGRRSSAATPASS